LLDGKHARKVLSKKLRRARKISFAKGVELMLLNGSKVVMMAAVTASVNGCKTMTFMAIINKGNAFQGSENIAFCGVGWK
jgi:hypothetical protein